MGSRCWRGARVRVNYNWVSRVSPDFTSLQGQLRPHVAAPTPRNSKMGWVVQPFTMDCT
jgi:hypothetical protein